MSEQFQTTVFVWNIVQARPRIKVDLLPGAEGSGASARLGVLVVIRNVSSHDVHFGGVDILYQYTRVRLRDYIAHMRRFRTRPRRLGWVHVSVSHLSVDSGCPLRLEARKAHHVFLSDQTVEELLARATTRQLMACVQDQLWNDVYSGTLSVPTPKSG